MEIESHFSQYVRKEYLNVNCGVMASVGLLKKSVRPFFASLSISSMGGKTALSRASLTEVICFVVIRPEALLRVRERQVVILTQNLQECKQPKKKL